MRIVGMDIHRVFGEVALLVDGVVRRLGRVEMQRDRLEAFARAKLTSEDHVVVEATGNASALAEVLRPFVGRVVIANPKQVRLIAHAKIKTDGIDAVVLAKLYATGFLPEVWAADDKTLVLRRQVTRRRQLVRQRTRLKNMIQSILHAHLIPPCPHVNIVGISGKRWLRQQVLPEDERQAIERHLTALDQLGGDLKLVEHDIAERAVTDVNIKRLMTLPGVDMAVASGLAAAIGDINRFATAQQLVAYLGLNPSVRQSGEGPAYHGRITKQGRGYARGMLVEAAWATARSVGPLRAFFLRISARRGQHVAAVATARKLATIAWYMLRRGEDYVWVRPALHARKLRELELRAGSPSRRGQKGTAYEYNRADTRARERRRVEQAERSYERLVSGWKPTGRRRSSAQART